ncbi:MAG: OmpA family protein [Rickettsiales bacterium]|jgi:outer membrane protein OmpA-like peptidoglycan-associated protein|nr:OmpA family protein [Rickettsiales bacterium]
MSEEAPGVGDLLAIKYYDYADVLEKNQDYTSSRYFAKLSKEAKNGNFGEKFKSHDVIAGRPEQIADMYFLFNCWYYFETNDKNLGEATICKNSFLKLNSILSKSKKSTKVDYDKQPVHSQYSVDLTRDEEIILSEFIEKGSMDITFDYDNYKLNPDAVIKIGLILRYLNTLENDYKIILVGHADRSGKSIYNNTIARRRANTILNTFLKNGIPRDLIEVQAFGSRSPRIITRKDTKNQYNRRVEVILNTNYRIQNFLPQPILPSKTGE